jgi:hypothetical protein
MSGQSDFSERNIQGVMTPAGDEQITSISTVKSLTPVGEAQVALVTVTTQNVRLRYGADPTASLGARLEAGVGAVWVYNIHDARLIEEVGGAVVDVQYFK